MKIYIPVLICDRENVFFACAYSMTISYGTLAVLLSSAGCRPGHTLRADMDAVCDANVCQTIPPITEHR
jgi:hypothetical protein